MCGEVICVPHRPNGLKINPDGGAGRKSKDSEIVAMRHIELQIRLRKTSRKRWLAAVAVNQFNGLRAHIQTRTEHAPQTRSGDRKPAAIAVKSEATGSVPLLIRKQRGGSPNGLRRNIESSHDDFNRIARTARRELAR